MPYQVKLSPFNAPNYDVFSPSRLSDPRGVILGAPLDGAQSYVPWIGLSTVRELALKYHQKTGVVDDRVHDGLVEELNHTRQLLAAAEARVAELEEFEGHLAGMAKHGFRVQKQMGRPKKEASA